MSKIAVLSDIHGNSAALRAVLRDLHHQKIEECFILGDLIGYYYRPLEVLRLLDESNISCQMIRGNHERMLERALRDELKWEDIRSRYGHGIEIAAQQLPEKLLKELLSLPDQRKEERDGKKFLLCHGSPVDKDRYVYPDAEDSIFDFPDMEADYVLLGHTHYPMMRCCSSFCIINPGSVGQARGRGGLAEWCIINTDNNVVTMHKTPYDVEPVLQDGREYDPNIAYLQDVLRR